jgi:hypothetical protein
MAVVQNTYTGDGVTVLYSLSFPYLDRSDVKVSVNGTIVTNYIFATDTSIQFLAAPGAGASIRIYRDTDNEETKATIFPGSAIKAQDLNANFSQTLYSVQEIAFRALSKFGDTMLGILNMGGFKIINVGTPTLDADSATKKYVDDRYGQLTVPGVTRWRQTATADQTVFSGAGEYGGTLAYSASRETVFINGVLQQRNVDYTADNGTTVTFAVALEVGDVVDVHCVNNANGTTTDQAGGIYWTQTGSGAITRTVDSKLKEVVSVKDFGAVGNGVVDDTAAIQAAIDYAYTQAIPIALTGQPAVYFPSGQYLISSSLVLRDYTCLRGAGARSSIIKGSLTNKSFLRGPYGENPTYGSRLVGWEISDLVINNSSRLTGSIGLNMRGVGYSNVRNVVVTAMDTALATTNECYYVTFSQCWFGGNIAAYLQSDGGGNSFSGCHFNAEVKCVDIESGTWDFFGGVMDVNQASATHIIKLGRASGIAAVANLFGVYVEGLSISTLTAELGATTSTSGFYGVHRHNILGGVTNNASVGAFQCYMTTGYFDIQTRTNELQLGDGTITSNPRSKINSPAGNRIDFISGTTPGAYADHYYRTGYPQQGIAFPVTQYSSADANTLDDYEEGTWTPGFTRETAPTFVYGDRVGVYTKVGDTVTINGSLFVSSVSSSGGGLCFITGIPFAAKTLTSFSASGPVSYFDMVSGGGDSCYLGTGGTTLVLTKNGDFVNNTFTSGRIYFSIVYKV